MDPATVERFLEQFETTVSAGVAAPLDLVGEGALSSVFATTDLAAASVACAGRGAARVAALSGGVPSEVRVDARLASWWFRSTLVPDGWTPPPVWDAIAGDYPCGDGWIRLHTNAPHHRRAALSALGCAQDRDAVATAVATWVGGELEDAVVAAGGCAAVMRGEDEWRAHPQGRSVLAEPVLSRTSGSRGPERRPAPRERPLAGVRVLDLTRVLAGPVATRFLAGLGADVLRIDPPDWDEPSIVPEVTRGKRCARLDLRRGDDFEILRSLLADADLLVHGYRPGALEGLGLGSTERAALCPGIVEVSLDAYGWTGPWSGRRGFDSLVQMSTGIAHAGMVETGADRPTPLPVQALDHAAGHIVAAAALHGWADRIETGSGSSWRTSLARVAAVLASGPRRDPDSTLARPGPDDREPGSESTPWGPAGRLRPPLEITNTPLRWDRPSSALGDEQPPLRWQQDRLG